MKTTYVLGAGTDVPLGLPVASALLAELDTFVKGDGKALSQILRKKLGRFQFGFEKYSADQGEGFAERVLADADLGKRLKTALEKTVEPSDAVSAVIQVLGKLETIREANSLDDETSNAIAQLAGEDESMADHTLLRLRGVGLNPVPRTAIASIFRGAQSNAALTKDEKQALDSAVAIMTNFEELLTELFAGFYTGNAASQRKYLYVSWVLWAYMRWRSLVSRGAKAPTPSFYDRLEGMGADDRVVTFNYTDVADLPAGRTIRFHGDCLSYLRYDQGQVIFDDEAVTGAADLDAVATFIEGLDIDLAANKVYLPAIVPPSAMKPVLDTHFVKAWEECRVLLADSDLLFVVGYAFNPVDRHFNDIFRSAARTKRVVVVNPDLEGNTTSVCRLLGITSSSLTDVTLGGFAARQSEQLVIVGAGSSELSEEFFQQLRQPPKK